MTRPCGCPGAEGSRHLTPYRRKKLGLKPCPRRGASSGPSGQHTDATKVVRLRRGLAEAAQAVSAAGRDEEGEAALWALARAKLAAMP